MATWYDHPKYFEMVFRDETSMEVEFFQQAFDHYASRKVQRIFEPGCGGGRLVVGMAKEGFHSIGLDLSSSMVKYANRQLRRRKLHVDQPDLKYGAGQVVEGDMTQFKFRPKFDAVHCTFNTFRHLMTDKEVEDHFHCVADHLKKGGLYILGFHLIPPDAEESEIERWRATEGGTTVACTLRVLDFDRRTRRENIRINIKATKKSGEIERIKSEFPLRLYSATQVKSLFRKIDDKFELLATHDFGYEMDETFDIDDDLADALFILRRR